MQSSESLKPTLLHLSVKSSDGLNGANTNLMVQGARRGQPKYQLPVRRGGLFEHNMLATKALSSKLFFLNVKYKKESMKCKTEPDL